MSTLGKNIRALRTMKGISQTELAKVLDLQRSTVTKWETGAILSIRASHLDDLCAHYGLSKDDILSSDAGLAAQLAAANGEVDHSRSAGFVPLYELEYDDYLDAKRWVELPLSFARRCPDSYCVEVNDEGVNRVLPAGSIALVEPVAQGAPVTGSLCLVELDDGRRMIRRVHAGASNSMLTPESWTVRDDETVSNDQLRVIGSVVWWQGGEARVVA